MRISRLSHAPGTVLGHRRDGRPIHVIAGGAPDDDAGAEDGGQPDDDGSSTDTGDDSDTTDWQAESAKWQALAKKHEGRARQNADDAKELAELKRLHQSESERKVDDARRETADKYRGQIARHAVVAAAATAKVSIPENALKRMDLTDLVDDDGQVDTDALTELVSGFAPIPDTGTGAPRQLPPDPAQRGRNRGNGGKTSADDRLAAGAELYRTHFPMKS